MLPSYSHSMLEQWEACPFAGGAALLAEAQNHRDAEALGQTLEAYLKPSGIVALMGQCGNVGPPIPSNSFVTLRGSAFHQFAEQYGRHLLAKGVRFDGEFADRLAKGKAIIDGEYHPSAYNMMRLWAETWDFDPKAAEAVFIDDTPFETEWRQEITDGKLKFEYVWHPDFALLYNREHRGELDKDGIPFPADTLIVRDYKTSVNSGTFDPFRPDRQLARYALGFWLRFPQLKQATLEKHWVNPDCKDADGDPAETHVWHIDLTREDALDLRELLSGPVQAIREEREFRPNPGCWLCGFCDWTRDCPALEQVEKLLAQTPEEAIDAWTLHEALGQAAKTISAKRDTLRKQVQTWVKANGPLKVSGGKLYEPRQMEVVKVTSPSRLLASVRARGDDADAYIEVKPCGLKGAKPAIEHLRALGEKMNRDFVVLETGGRSDIPPAYLQTNDPFAPEDAPPLEGVKVIEKEVWGTYPDPAATKERDDSDRAEAALQWGRTHPLKALAEEDPDSPYVNPPALPAEPGREPAGAGLEGIVEDAPIANDTTAADANAGP